MVVLVIVAFLISLSLLSCRICIFPGVPQQSQMAQSSGSSHWLEEELLAALHCLYYWPWTTFVELLKVSTGTAISFLATLLSDNLPSVYVVITVVNWCFWHCSWQARFPRAPLRKKAWKAWHCCMPLSFLCVIFHKNRGGEIILLKNVAPPNKEKEWHPSTKICHCQTFSGEPWGVWSFSRRFEIV